MIPTPILRGLRLSLAGLAVAGLTTATGCGDDANSDAKDARPTVVVTTPILGSLVEQLVGADAEVQVLIPNGADPHDFSPSARDIAALGNATLIVSNGLDLEEGMVEAIENAEGDGVAVFHAADHVTVREIDEEGGHDEHADEHADDGHEHHHEGGDPHIWTDPLTMREMVPSLTTALERATGVQLDATSTALTKELTALDGEVRSILAGLPAGGCRLVTGHDSLGYFAERYGCEIVGTVIPGLSSTAEESAKDLASLQDAIAEAQVTTVFTEVGTPKKVAEQVATETGARLVELPSHGLATGGDYRAFITELATRIHDGLSR